MKTFVKRALVPVVALGGSVSAMAQTAPATVADLASSVSFTDVAAAILGVAGTIISLYVIWKGAKFVISAVKGA